MPEFTIAGSTYEARNQVHAWQLHQEAMSSRASAGKANQTASEVAPTLSSDSPSLHRRKCLESSLPLLSLVRTQTALPVLSAATGTTKTKTRFACALRFCFQACDSHSILHHVLVSVTRGGDRLLRMRIIPRSQIHKNLFVREHVSQAANNSEQVIVATEFLDCLSEFTPYAIVKLPCAR
jgi:hypothetical protein